MSDRLIGLLVTIFAAVMYYESYAFKPPPFQTFEGMGAEFFPRAILIGLGVLGMILLITGKGPLLPRWTLGGMRAALPRYRGVIISVILFPLYIVGITFIGFLYSTIIYMIVMQLALFPRRGLSILYVIAGSAVFSFALVEVFRRLLNVVLPRGSLF
jgi:hypothetical protein